MTPLRNHLPLFAVLLWAMGCHRSLQIGEPLPYDGGIADTHVVDADLPDTADATPWYVREQAYVGPELRLPVPAGDQLVQHAAVNGVDPSALTVSAPPSGELLIASQTRLWAVTANGDSPQLATPAGVELASENAALLPNRRTAILTHSGQSLFRRLAPAPDWTVTPYRLISLQAEATVTATATNAAGDSLVQMDRFADRWQIAFTVRADEWGNDWRNASPGQIARPYTYDEPEAYGNPLALAAHGDTWLRVALLRPNGSNWRDYTLSVQAWRGSAEGGSPWGAPILTTPQMFVSNNGTTSGCESVHAAVSADNNLLVSCFSNGTMFVRAAALEEPHWLGSWIDIGSTDARSNIESNAVMWDAPRNRFAVAFPSRSGTIFRFLSSSGQPISAPVGAPLSRVSMVLWQQQLWAVGFDVNGWIRLLRPELQTATLRFHRPGSQEVDSALSLNESVLVSWSDSERTFVSRVDFESGMRAESAAVLALPGGTLLRDGANSYVTRTSMRGWENGQYQRTQPLQSSFARLHPETLVIDTPVQIPSDRFVTQMAVHGDTVTMFCSSGRNLHAISSTDTSFVEQWSTSGTRLRRELLPISTLNRPFDCHGQTCFSYDPGLDPSVIDLRAMPVALRRWNIDDVSGYPTCSPPPGDPQQQDSVPRNVAFSCDWGRLPGANAPYTCINDSTGDVCGGRQFDAIANSDSHTLVVEARGSWRSGEFVRERFVLRLFAHRSASAAATLSLPASELAGAGLGTAFVRAFAIRGGLFALVYTRANQPLGTIEAFARTVYFPEAETVAP